MKPACKCSYDTHGTVCNIQEMPLISFLFTPVYEPKGDEWNNYTGASRIQRKTLTLVTGLQQWGSSAGVQMNTAFSSLHQWLSTTPSIQSPERRGHILYVLLQPLQSLTSLSFHDPPLAAEVDHHHHHHHHHATLRCSSWHLVCCGCRGCTTAKQKWRADIPCRYTWAEIPSRSSAAGGVVVGELELAI